MSRYLALDEKVVLKSGRCPFCNGKAHSFGKTAIGKVKHVCRTCSTCFYQGMGGTIYTQRRRVYRGK